LIKRVLIIGGYGNFGSFITKALALEVDIQVVVAGRSLEKAKQLISNIEAKNKPEALMLDISLDITSALNSVKPSIVIHTSGPFQEQGYDVAEACINNNIHYIDLANSYTWAKPAPP